VLRTAGWAAADAAIGLQIVGFRDCDVDLIAISRCISQSVPKSDFHGGGIAPQGPATDEGCSSGVAEYGVSNGPSPVTESTAVGLRPLSRFGVSC